MKKYMTAVLFLLSAGLLMSCQEKVVTVADIISEDGQEASYLEIKEFELKGMKEETDAEEVKYCAVLIPAGYNESDELPGMYIHSKSPLDSSNIYYSVSEGIDARLGSEVLTEDTYKTVIEEAYKSSGESVELDIQSFEEIDMNGVPAYKIRSSYEAEDNIIEQLAYLILGDNTYTVTYSQSADDELMADFEISDGEIKLVREES